MTTSPIDLQRALAGISYPASKDELIEQARENSADDAVQQVLKDLPDDEYDSPAAVSAAASDDDDL